MTNTALSTNPTFSVKTVDLGPTTRFSEQPTEPYGPLDLSWLDKPPPYNYMASPEHRPFDTQKPPEGIEFLALLNQTEQLLPYYEKQHKGEPIFGDVAGKIIEVQVRLSALLTKPDPFEECADLKEALKLLFLMREVVLRDGESSVLGYQAVNMLRSGETDNLPPNIVNGINRLRGFSVTTIAP
jgi:hypothetical protein